MNQHNKNIENDVIGILILYPHSLIQATPILKVDYLYQNETKIVYTAIMELYKNSNPIDLVTICTELKKRNQLEFIGGPSFVSSLTRTGDVQFYSLEFKCYQIHELYILRQLSILGEEIKNATSTANADCFEISERILKRTSELIDIRSEKIKTAGDFFYELVEDINQVLEGNKPTGLMSNLKNLDDLTGGWQPGNLIIIAARPGMGKTAIALQLAKHPAFELKKPVAIFSLEMSGKELIGRMAASESDLSSTDVIQNKINRLELQKMGSHCVKLIDSSLYIDDTPGLNINQLRAKAKKLFYENKIELIIVDYLQKMSPTNKKGNKEQDVSEISGGLKDLARELNIPVIALAQLNRAVEDRPDKRPMLRDLRDSGAIEQDADIVGFLFRPEYYDLFPNGYEFRANVLETPNLMIFDIAKGRGLEIREIPLKFYGKFMRIENYSTPSLHVSEKINALETNNNFLND